MGFFDFLKSKPDPAVANMDMDPIEVTADVLNSFMGRAESNIDSFVNQLNKTAKKYGINPGYLWHVLTDPTERQDWPDMSRRQKTLLTIANGIVIWADKQPKPNRLAVPPYEKMGNLDRAIMSLGVWTQDVLTVSLLRDYKKTVREKAKKYEAYVLNYFHDKDVDETDPLILLSTLCSTILRRSPLSVYAQNVMPLIFRYVFELY